MHTRVTLDADDLAGLTLTGDALSDGRAQLVLRGVDVDLQVFVSSSDMLRLSQLFAGLADEIAAVTGVAAVRAAGEGQGSAHPDPPAATSPLDELEQDERVEIPTLTDADLRYISVYEVWRDEQRRVEEIRIWGDGS